MHSMLNEQVTERRSVRYALIGTALLFLGVFLVLPVVAVFAQALRAGGRTYLAAITHPDALHAIMLTVGTAAIAVPANMVFGVAAAWAIAKFEFRGRSLLVTLIDLPFAISPVISGLLFVLLYGLNGVLGSWLDAHGLTVIFAVPGIVLVTIFVTVPFVT
ncbi:MAG TPA: hypothetical protein VF021_11615, partial [Longimicrobiales bacterium]